jgi:acyl-CoA hydrolase
MPRTHGAGIIHISELNTFVEVNEPILEHQVGIPTEIEQKIGDYIAALIEDRSTLQMGVGNIPNAVLSRLGNHKDLGLHTEMFSDGVIDLILKDVINGNYKEISPGRAMATFLMGTRRLYDYVDDNPFVEMREADFVNDVYMIRQNHFLIHSRKTLSLKCKIWILKFRHYVQDSHVQNSMK